MTISSRCALLRASLLISVFAATVSPAIAQAGGVEPPKVEVEEPAGPFALLRVDAEFQIVPKASVKTVKKEIDTAHTAAVKRWKEAKAAAKKAKEKFDQPQPKKPKLKIVGSAYKTEEAAGAARDALIEKERKQAEKRRKKAPAA